MIDCVPNNQQCEERTFNEFQAYVLCSKPNNEIFQFDGVIKIEYNNYQKVAKKFLLAYDDIMLKGTYLKNTN